MKRHLISDETTEKDGLKQCPKTSLSILGNCQTLIREDRDASESERRDCKRPKLQFQQEQETSTSMDDDNHRSKLRYLDLVSSAVNLLCAVKGKKEEHQTPLDSTCSAVSMASTTRGSRSNSISSEHSVYRTYEMELPYQPHTKFMSTSRLLRAPRLPTATDVPIAQEIGYQLNSRRYGERPAFIDSNEEEGNNETIGKNLLNQQIRIQPVIYR